MVRIITDSAADFDPVELEKLNITCIPLTVQIDDNSYEDNVTLSKDRFYELLSASSEFPKTSQSPIKTVLDLYQEAKSAGDEVVHITLSSALSGTYQTALAVRDMVGFDGCYIVDSKNATGGQRMLTEYAVKLRDEGKSAPEIAAAVESLRSRIVLYACIDTLEYLFLGGRISRTAYKLGNLAQIKPIIRVAEDGRIEVPAKAMGMRRGIDILSKKVAAIKPSTEFPFYAMYTSDRAAGEHIAERVRTLGVDIPDDHIIQVGAAIGAHIGPNALGFIYVAE